MCTRIFMCQGIDWADLLSQIFYDPSKRDGSPDKAVRDKVIKFRPNDGGPGRSQSNHTRTFNLTGDAMDALCSPVAITQPFDSVLRQLDFIGASNFWHTLRVALNR